MAVIQPVNGSDVVVRRVIMTDDFVDVVSSNRKAIVQTRDTLTICTRSSSVFDIDSQGLRRFMHLTKDAMPATRRYTVDFGASQVNLKTDATMILNHIDDSKMLIDSIPAMSKITRFDAVDVLIDKSTGTVSVMTIGDCLVIDVKMMAK